jgi:hypothetical protein
VAGWLVGPDLYRFRRSNRGERDARDQDGTSYDGPGPAERIRRR